MDWLVYSFFFSKLDLSHEEKNSVAQEVLQADREGLRPTCVSADPVFGSSVPREIAPPLERT